MKRSIMMYVSILGLSHFLASAVLAADDTSLCYSTGPIENQDIFARRAMEGRRPRREARDSPEGALSHCVSLRASDSEVAQVSAGRSRQKESLAASPRAPGGLGCPVAQS
jgi:hypothetical protein